MSSVVLNPQLATLPVYVPGKPIDEVAREHGLQPADIIKLASNENPLGPSPMALAAMADVLKNLHLYPDGNSFHLKRKLAAKLGVEPANLVLGSGSNEIIEFLGHALLGAGDEVLVSEHCFAVYPIVAALFGAKLVTVPARGFHADVEGLLRAVTPRTKLLFLANPNNPTGTLTSRDDLSRLLAEVPPHVLIALDEAYVEFLADPLDSIALVRSGVRPNLVLLRTFSKIFGLAGLRLGYGIGAQAVVNEVEKARGPYKVNAVAERAATAAVTRDRDWLDGVVATTRAARESLTVRLRDLGFQPAPSDANFVTVPVADARATAAHLADRSIAVRAFAGLPVLGDVLRITVGPDTMIGPLVDALRGIPR